MRFLGVRDGPIDERKPIVEELRSGDGMRWMKWMGFLAGRAWTGCRQSYVGFDRCTWS